MTTTNASLEEEARKVHEDRVQSIDELCHQIRHFDQSEDSLEESEIFQIAAGFQNRKLEFSTFQFMLCSLQEESPENLDSLRQNVLSEIERTRLELMDGFKRWQLDLRNQLLN